MKTYFLNENIWNGGVFLDDEMFREIAQPSFEYISLPKPDRLYLSMKEKGEDACQVVVSARQYVEKYGIVGVRRGGKKEQFHVVRSALAGYVEAIQREQTGYREFEEYVVLRVCAEQKDDSAFLACNEKADENMISLLMTSGIPGINRILFDGNRQRNCHTIVLNAVVDDPSMLYDILMMKERPGQIVYGLLIFYQMLAAEKIVIAVSRRQEKIVKTFVETVKKYFTEEMEKSFCLLFVPDVYPGGKDELLSQNLTQWMEDQTWIMLHMDQVLGAYDMVYDHKPWTRQHLLVGGCMSVNGCCELPVGTRVEDAVNWLHERLHGCRKEERWLEQSGILIEGGLMAGAAVNLKRAVVHSGMHSFLILPRMEENEKQCLGCARCEQVCPKGIVPWQEWKAADRSRCIGCGSCSYICPSRRRIKEFMLRGGRREEKAEKRGNYIELPKDCRLISAAVTGYSSPYIRSAETPFTCILSPFKL